jgi:hypothetical protein
MWKLNNFFFNSDTLKMSERKRKGCGRIAYMIREQFFVEANLLKLCVKVSDKMCEKKNRA